MQLHWFVFMLLTRVEGGMHDDLMMAPSDLLHRFPTKGSLDLIQDIIIIREATSLKLGVDLLSVDLNLKAAGSSNDAFHIRIGKLLQDEPGELPIAGCVTSSATVFDPYFHPHRCCCCRSSDRVSGVNVSD